MSDLRAIVAALLAASGWLASPAWSQSPESDVTPEAAAQGLDLATFQLPDVPESTLESINLEDGHQADDFEVRSFRLSANGSALMATRKRC